MGRKVAIAQGGGEEALSKPAVPTITWRFVVPPPERLKELAVALEAAMDVIHAASKIKLSDKTQEAMLTARAAYEKSQSRETEDARLEAAERKRLEKKKLVDDKVEQMTPEQQRKFEIKTQKKLVKSQMAKVKKIKG
eukprot:GHVT01086161.1.p1 GENE.GHVT01086161.1~~GHVT01086161.1.p1  ORF type:complete len:144 (-),score=42.43 GHVT01086161.1:478-888(-)